MKTIRIFKIIRIVFKKRYKLLCKIRDRIRDEELARALILYVNWIIDAVDSDLPNKVKKFIHLLEKDDTKWYDLVRFWANKPNN